MKPSTPSDKGHESSISRRQFVVGMGAAAGALTTYPRRTRGAENSGEPDASSGDSGKLWREAAGKRHDAAERDSLFQNNLKLRAAEISNSQFDGINGLEDWEQRKPDIRRQYLDMMGLEPMPVRTPLNPRVTGGFEKETYRVENIVFESMPGFYVTGNLYLPKGSDASRPLPTVLYVSGHAPGPAGAKAHYQHHGIWLARHGLVAFLLDTIEFGEIPGIHHGLHDLQMRYWLSLNYTPAGPEVWNAIRALDYLETRSEVDHTKIGMTGRSGGGAITWFTAAADDRIRVAVPVHGTWSIGPHVAHHVVPHNCDCIYFWNTHQLDLPTVGALIAPRPLKIINAKQDLAFPPSGYEPVCQKLRRVYDWHDAADRIEEFELDTPHSDLPPYQREAHHWLTRWLTGSSIAFDEHAEIPHEDHSRLSVLNGRLPQARNYGIQRNFIATHKPSSLDSLEAWRKRRKQLLRQLNEHVYHAFPDEKQPFGTWKNEIRNWATRYTDAYDVEFTTERSIRVQGQLFVPRTEKTSHPALIYVKGADDIVYSIDYDLILSALGNHVVLVLHPRAIDYGMNNQRKAANDMTAGLLGTTIETLQLWDLVRSIDFLQLDQGLNLNSVSVFGRNQMAALAIHAGAIDNRVTRVIVDDPPRSHWQDPPLLNILRITDLAEIAGLIAPRELVSLTPLPGEYEYTASIYDLYTDSIGIGQADSLAHALKVWEHT